MASSGDNPFYTSFWQHFAYRIDTGISSIPSLNDDYNEAITYAHAPRIFLTIIGEIEAFGVMPEVPKPPYPIKTRPSTIAGGMRDVTLPECTLITYKVEPQSPTQAGEYKVRYTYVLQLHNFNPFYNLETAALKLRGSWTPYYIPPSGWQDDAGHKYEDMNAVEVN